PAEGAEIFCKFVPDNAEKFPVTLKSVKTLSDGLFEFHNLGAGRAYLSIIGTGEEKILSRIILIEKGKSPETLSLKLEQGRTVSGVVVDEEGTSQTKTRLYYFDITGHVVSAWTDAQGEFTLKGLGEGGIYIKALSADKPEIGKMLSADGRRERIVLKKGASIMGKIFRADNKQPIPLAIFSVRNHGECLTNSRGEFQYHYLSEDKTAYTSANAENLASKYGPILQLKPGSAHYGLDFALSNGGTVSGYVFDEGTNKPIIGAKVFCTIPDIEPVYTDENGHYKLTNMPEVDLMLSASAEGYSTAKEQLAHPKEGEELTKINFYLKKAAQISGVIKTKAGEPVCDAEVGAAWGRFSSLIKDFNNETAKSGSDGQYTLSDIPAEEPISLRAKHDDHAPTFLGPLYLKPGEKRQNVDFIMTEGGSIAGAVMDENGKPLPETEVAANRPTNKHIMSSFVDIASTMETAKFVSADEEGKYEIKHLAPGDYLVLARAKKTAKPQFVYDLKKNIVVVEEETTAGVNFKLKRAAALAGFIRDDTGKGIEGARIAAFQMNFEKPMMQFDSSKNDGAFRIDGLPAGGYMLTAEKRPHPQIMKTNVIAPNENLELIMESGGTIRGIVLDKKTKKPIADYKIIAEYASAGLMPGMGMNIERQNNRSQDVRNDTGTFEITGLKSGKYNLKVRAASYASGQKSGIKVESNKTVEGIVIDMDVGIAIKGRVVRALDKSPVSGASVRVAGGEPNMFGMDMDIFDFRPKDSASLSDEQGQFTLENLTGGLKNIEAKKEGFLKGKKSIFVREDVPNEPVEIEMAQGGTVSGRVILKSSGEPLSDAEITFAGQGLIPDMVPFLAANVKSDNEGRFSFKNVPAGKQTLKVSHKSASPAMVENIEVNEGGELDVGDIALTAGGSIAGVVLDLGGKPISGAFIVANASTGIFHNATNEQGEYSINELAPQTYTVSAMLSHDMFFWGQTGNVQQQQALVEEGKVTELNFTISPGYNLSGRITQNNKPYTDATLNYSLNDPLQPMQNTGNIRANSDGRYIVKEIQPGLYNINVMRGQQRPGQIPIPVFTGSVEVRNDTVYDIEIPTASIEGRVIDFQTGEPIAGASLSIIRSTDAQTLEEVVRTGRFGLFGDSSDSDGRYLLEDVQDGDLTVFCQHEKYTYERHSMSITAGEKITNVDFLLKPGLALSGKGVMKMGGAPIARLFINMRDAGGAMIYNSFVPMASDGQFTITGLKEGDYTLNAYPQNAAPLYNTRCAIKAGTSNNVLLEFSQGGTLIANVVGDDDKPVAKAKVDIIDSTGKTLELPATFDNMMAYNSLAFTDEKGRLERKNIPAGSYAVRVQAFNYKDETVDARIEEGEQTLSAIKLSR
ncbi:MAG TPA: carboxypeptidase regulatory-like domain-containing protein, partial [Candidatus Sumerlaeia bacterium]|nr:carboxypeptidase regulatory-like domain-containing protein [Candidatus Sumerlaeia bacterium]